MSASEGKLLSGTYDYVFSLGAACSCTQLLRRMKLQFRSLPFDWLYGCSFVDRCSLIADNFQTWLNKEELEYQGCRTTTLPHRYVYKSTATGIVYNHDFFGVSLDETFDAVKRKYDRRIARLLSSIESSKKVLVVYIDVPSETSVLSREEMLLGAQKLQDRFPHVQIDVLYLHNDDKMSYEEKEVEVISSHICKCTYCYNAFDATAPHVVDFSKLAKALGGIKISPLHLTVRDMLRARKLWSLLCSRYAVNRNTSVIRILGFPIYKFRKSL